MRLTDAELRVALQLARGVALDPPFIDRCHWQFTKSLKGPSTLVLTVESNHIRELFRDIQVGALVSLKAVVKAVGGTEPPSARKWIDMETAMLSKATQVGDDRAELHFVEHTLYEMGS